MSSSRIDFVPVSCKRGLTNFLMHIINHDIIECCDNFSHDNRDKNFLYRVKSPPPPPHLCRHSNISNNQPYEFHQLMLPRHQDWDRILLESFLIRFASENSPHVPWTRHRQRLFEKRRQLLHLYKTTQIETQNLSRDIQCPLAAGH